MSVKYVRDTYGVPAKVGGLVRRIDAPDEKLMITSCTHHVRARHLFSSVVHSYHPHDLEYFTGEGWFRAGEKAMTPPRGHGMKLIIAGGRNINHPGPTRAAVVESLLRLATEVVTGGSPGIDSWGEGLARSAGVQVEVFHANWTYLGRRAGPIRNQQMAEYADACVLLPGGRGTEDMARAAKRAGLWVFDLRGDGAEDRQP